MLGFQQTQRDNGEAGVRLAIRTAVDLLPQAHQLAGGKHDRTASVSEAHVPERTGLGLRAFRCHGE